MKRNNQEFEELPKFVAAVLVIVLVVIIIVIRIVIIVLLLPLLVVVVVVVKVVVVEVIIIIVIVIITVLLLLVVVVVVVTRGAGTLPAGLCQILSLNQELSKLLLNRASARRRRRQILNLRLPTKLMVPRSRKSRSRSLGLVSTQRLYSC